MGDTSAFALTLLICVGYISGLGWVSRRQILEKNLSRKLMHIGNGLLFIACWPAYSDAWQARYICAAVPFLASMHFALVGSGCVRDAALLQSATRTGDRQELLRGPLLYGLVISTLTALFWRASPIGVLAIAVLCAGDGAADIVGNRYGDSNRLFFSHAKSLAGSTACLGCGFVAGALCMCYLESAGVMVRLSAPQVVLGSLQAALVGAIVESLPIPEIDNVTVPLAVVVASRWFFASAGNIKVG